MNWWREMGRAIRGLDKPEPTVVNPELTKVKKEAKQLSAEADRKVRREILEVHWRARGGR